MPKHKSLTETAKTSWEERAQATPSESERLLFSEAAYRDFLAAITRRPDEPSKKLRDAVAACKRHEPSGHRRRLRDG